MYHTVKHVFFATLKFGDFNRLLYMYWSSLILAAFSISFPLKLLSIIIGSTEKGNNMGSYSLL